MKGRPQIICNEHVEYVYNILDWPEYGILLALGWDSTFGVVREP